MVVSPSEFRVPLNSQGEPIFPRIFKRFHQAVSSPCCRHQISTDRLNCLMMMTIDRRGLRREEHLKRVAGVAGPARRVGRGQSTTRAIGGLGRQRSRSPQEHTACT